MEPKNEYVRPNWADMLTSPDWRERSAGEYLFISEKIANLEKMLQDYSAKKLKFQPNCSLELLTTQLIHMKAYQQILSLRLNIENLTELVESNKY